MKKLLLTVMTISLLALPFGTVALAESQESSAAPAEEVCYVPGEAPAETGAVESMTPAIHAVILSMINHETTAFDAQDNLTAWEALYNMLSLYGQMDERSEYRDEALILPAETVLDFSTALFPEPPALDQLPEALADRMVYDKASGCFLLACGDDNLAEPRLESIVKEGGSLHITGSLVYLVDGTDLASFRATLSPRDNLFGYVITSLELL